MGAIYIGGQTGKKSGGLKWKIYFFLILVLAITGMTLKVAAPTIVEEWMNRNGAGKSGYAYSIRDVDIKFEKGQLILKDVKVFNPNTETKLLEVPELTVQLDVLEILQTRENKVSLLADKVDLILSKDLTSEIERIKTSGDKNDEDLYLDAVVGKIGQLNIIEKKEDLSRTVIELKDVNIKVKEVSLRSINKKTEFSITSKITDGGKLNLTGKTSASNGNTPWSINGALKQVPADIFNKMAGDKLPFAFNEPTLNADITAVSEDGNVSGEISPEVRKLNVLVEKPGIPTQSIARLLNEELTFTLPFTLNDRLTLQYADTYQELKSYRRYPAATESAAAPAEKLTQSEKPKKVLSFWPF